MSIGYKKTRRSQVTRPKSKRTQALSLPWKGVFTGVVMLALMGGIAGSYYWIQNPKHLTIKSVKVTGDLRVLDKTQLQPVIEPYTKTNLYLLETKKLEEALEKNPWVQSASMTHVWPDQLTIKIFEHHPVAFWGENSMLADNGVIIKAIEKDKKGILPTLYSPNKKGRNMAKGFLQIRQWMKGFPLKMVEFKENARGSWQITLDNGMVLKIGREQQEKRLKRFMVGYKQGLVNVIDNIRMVDLRYTNGFAVKWKKG